MTIYFKKVGMLLVTLALSSCASSPDQVQQVGKHGRYKYANDHAPKSPIRIDQIENPEPRYEPASLHGNLDYSINNQEYNIIHEPKDFAEEGLASWYGNKFHGHLTSNGEVYDMYSMSAAHKTLPIPCYVKVTNLSNKKTVIVRVNDRGPFHEGRIIDLSYSAATKLDVIATGTAKVKIEYISPQHNAFTYAAMQHMGFVIQVAAVGSVERAHSLAASFEEHYQVDAYIEEYNQVHRILVGPFLDQKRTREILQKIRSSGYPSAYIKVVDQNKFMHEEAGH